MTVQQATFTRVDGKYEVGVSPPAGALPGKGGLEISLSPKLAVPPPGLAPRSPAPAQDRS